MYNLLLSLILIFAGMVLEARIADAGESGVIFLYHHVDASTPASTSVSPAEFRAQLDLLEHQGFSVLPLMDLLDALSKGRPVPDRSVAITFDDAYTSILGAALPELEKRGWPFTIFVNSEASDEGYGGYLSWDELRRLGARGATIGNHSRTHAHLVRELDGESAAEWRARVKAEIEDAGRRLHAEVGDYLIPVFAYPYGEYTAEIEAIVSGEGLYGLGQQSGAIGPGSDFLALPRYPIATGLDLEADFALRARSRPLPLELIGTEAHIVPDGTDRPAVQFGLDAGKDIRVGELACYASGQGRMDIEWQGAEMREFIVRPRQALRPGRSKYNCTAPSRSLDGVYYWYGYLWMRKLANGRWYDE